MQIKWDTAGNHLCGQQLGLIQAEWDTATSVIESASWSTHREKQEVGHMCFCLLPKGAVLYLEVSLQRRILLWKYGL